MNKIYKSHDAARFAAINSFKENDAVAILDYPGTREELVDENNKALGSYPFVAVVLKGEISDECPFGDAYEAYYYED